MAGSSAVGPPAGVPGPTRDCRPALTRGRPEGADRVTDGFTDADAYPLQTEHVEASTDDRLPHFH